MTACQTFRFDFDPRFRLPLAALGVRDATAWVRLTAARLEARFGPWHLRTDLANIATTSLTGPFAWWRVVGPRLSLADRGVTLGTNTVAGVCVTFHEPVALLAPKGLIRHPGLTVTVSTPATLQAALGPT